MMGRSLATGFREMQHALYEGTWLFAGHVVYPAKKALARCSPNLIQLLLKRQL